MKKNGFLTFCLSFIPGGGLMYLGYMKKGLQNMLMFAASVVCAIWLSNYYFFDLLRMIFIFLLPVIWFYQFFDTMHALSRMRALVTELPDDDGFYIPQFLRGLPKSFNRTAAKVLAITLICAGLFGIASAALDSLYLIFDHEVAKMIRNTANRYVVPALVSAVLIFVGIKLLKGSRLKDTNVLAQRADEADLGESEKE